MILAYLAAVVVLVIVISVVGMALWALISIGVVGIVIGGLARLVLPGVQNISVLATIFLGWIGSIVGGFVGYRIVHTGRILTVLLEIAVAAALIGLYSSPAGRSYRRRVAS